MPPVARPMADTAGIDAIHAPGFRQFRVARRRLAGANQTVSMPRSIYRRPWVDQESLQNPIELCLTAAGRLNKMRPLTSTLAGPLPQRRRAGIPCRTRTAAGHRATRSSSISRWHS